MVLGKISANLDVLSYPRDIMSFITVKKCTVW